ncbi:transmembrane protein 18-domain-containing protein [Obelidium mucronatum]|nr:transmembrane protein 18-domain-containing protein [Obelidium mucronatum]
MPTKNNKLTLDAIFNDPTLINWDSAESVFKDLKTDVMSFIEAVDWNEPLFKGLGLLHGVTFCLVVLLWWKKAAASTTGFIVLTCLTGLILGSEHLNSLASLHFARFSETNYFDKNGAFITTVFSGPILANILLLLFAMLREVAQLLILSKRKQLGLKNRNVAVGTDVDKQSSRATSSQKKVKQESNSLRQRKSTK